MLTVWKLDHLGRSTRHVLDVIETVRERGVGFRSLTEGLDRTGPMGTAMLTIVAAFAQLERDTMVERTRAGLAAAAADNRHGGRPAKWTTLLLPGLRNSKARESTSTRSARCSESPAPRSTDTLYRRLRKNPRQPDDERPNGVRKTCRIPLRYTVKTLDCVDDQSCNPPLHAFRDTKGYETLRRPSVYPADCFMRSWCSRVMSFGSYIRPAVRLSLISSGGRPSDARVRAAPEGLRWSAHRSDFAHIPPVRRSGVSDSPRRLLIVTVRSRLTPPNTRSREGNEIRNYVCRVGEDLV